MTSERDLSILVGAAGSWHKRAGIRKDAWFELQDAAREPGLPDFPLSLVPFAEHPTFLALPGEAKQRILTLAWITYNHRVVEVEHLITNRAISMLTYGEIPGASDSRVRRALQQVLIDEQFHLMAHEWAVEQTYRLRDVERRDDIPHSIVFRRLSEAQQRCSEPWQRRVLVLLWTVVSEMTINAYLSLLAKAEGIQPLHRVLSDLHDKDELVHNALFLPLTRVILRSGPAEQRRFFVDHIPEAVDAFTEHDFSSWRYIVAREGVPGGEAMIDECEHAARTSGSRLVSDVSGVLKLQRALDTGRDDDEPQGEAKAAGATEVRFSSAEGWSRELDPQQPWVLLLDQPPRAVRWQVVAPVEHGEAYLQEREACWEELRARHGDRLWNGTVCTVRRVAVDDGVLSLHVSQCEYKDILFKNHRGPARVLAAHGAGSVEAHAFTAILPLDARGRAVLGVVGEGTVQQPGLADIIGGTLNLDEGPIAGIDDVLARTLEELSEESGLVVPRERCRLVSLNHHDGAFFFLYVGPLAPRHASPERLAAAGELAALLDTPLATLDSPGHRASDDLRFVQTYAARLPEVAPST